MKIYPQLSSVYRLSNRKNTSDNSNPYNRKSCCDYTLAYLDNLGKTNFGAISFKRKEIPLYAIKKEDRSCLRFDSAKKAADELGLNKRSVTKCLSNELNSTGGYFFIKAENVEKEDDDKNLSLDEIKLKELTDEKYKNDNKAVYAIKDRTYKRFDTQSAAKRELRLDPTGICDCLSGKLATTGGYVFIWAGDVEEIDENGKTIVDETKLSFLIKAAESADSSVYAIDEEGNYSKFVNPYSAAKELKINPRGVFYCVNGEQKTTNGFVFIRASEIEHLDENGEIALDKAKISELLKNFVDDRNAIYSISIKDGTWKKFLSQKEAAKVLNINADGIQHCVIGDYLTTNGYLFMKACDVEKEIENPDGTKEKVVDFSVLREVLFDYRSKGIYAIFQDGTVKRFDSQKQASDELNIEPSRISACVNNKRLTTNAMAFVRADIVEKYDENTGAVQVNNRILNKLKSRLLSKEIYAIDRWGKCTKYKNQKEAAEANSVDASDLIRHLEYGHNFSHGIYFIRAYKLEKQDEQGNTYLDGQKIKKAMRYIQKRAIYVMNPEQEIERIDSRWLAARRHKGFSLDRKTSQFFVVNGYTYVPASKVEFRNKKGQYILDKSLLKKEMDKLRKQAVYLYNTETGEYEKYNHRVYAIKFSKGFDFNKDISQYELKKEYLCIPAPEVEMLAQDGKYCLDENKLEQKIKEQITEKSLETIAC